MDIFGIGPLELVLIMLIALIFLGPKDMGKAGLAVGKFLRKIIMSEEWRLLTQASREIRNIPTRLVREAGLEEIKKEIPSAATLVKESGLADLQKELKQETDQMQEEFSAWTTPIKIEATPSAPEISPAPASPENTIVPPREDTGIAPEGEETTSSEPASEEKPSTTEKTTSP